MKQGEVFGRWTVLDATKGSLKVSCQCECGTIKSVYRSALYGKKSTSCGCCQRIRCIEANTTHDASRSLAYNSWTSMMNRCFDTSHAQYPRYGAAGITVCSKWLDFAKFFADMGERPSKAHTIDRVDGSKGYELGNCRWATKREQAANRRNNVVLVWRGQQMCLAEFARSISTNGQRVSDWLRKGKTVEEIAQIVLARPTIGRYNNDTSVQTVKP